MAVGLDIVLISVFAGGSGNDNGARGGNGGEEVLNLVKTVIVTVSHGWMHITSTEIILCHGMPI